MNKEWLINFLMMVVLVIPLLLATTAAASLRKGNSGTQIAIIIYS